MTGARSSATLAKQDRVITAAADQFIRHGFARTTMGDIARAAEISRPALYLLFPGKEELFAAAVNHLNRLRMAEIESALAGCKTLEERLFTACRLWLGTVFELQCTTPDARDMDDLSFPVVREVYAVLETRIAMLLADAGPTPAIPPDDLARVLVFAVRGFGAIAKDPQEMTSMTRQQVKLCCALLEVSSAT